MTACRAYKKALRNSPDGQVHTCPHCGKHMSHADRLASHIHEKHVKLAHRFGPGVPQPKPAEPEPPLCTYCEEPAEFWTSSAALYNGRDYGPMWVCEACQAWVGCHPGGKLPLSILADKELRQAKMAAHAAFDRLWRAKARKEGCSHNRARGAAYAWLAQQLEIDPLYCHIGLMNVERCKRVVELCAPYHAERRRAA